MKKLTINEVTAAVKAAKTQKEIEAVFEQCTKDVMVAVYERLYCRFGCYSNIKRAELIEMLANVIISNRENGADEVVAEVRRQQAERKFEEDQATAAKSGYEDSETANMEKVAEFKRVFDELNKGNRIFVRICDIRRKLNWSREEFDGMLVALRDAEVIQLCVGDASLETEDEIQDSFKDENSYRMGTLTWNEGSEIRDVEINEKIISGGIKITNGIIKVSDFRALFNELDKGRIFVRICDLRRKAELSREVFDEMLRKLRDAEVIQIHEGDNSTMTADERADCFVDENGVHMGTVTWNDWAVIRDVEIEVSDEPMTEEVKVVDDFDYSRLTVKELKELAKFKKIRGYSRMRKAQLVAIFNGEIEAPKPETKYTVKLLREVAKDRKIKGYSRMRKSDLMAALAA